MTLIKRIPIEKLEKGMYVTAQNSGIADGVMREQGFINKPETIAKLRKKKLKEVWIDVTKGKDSPFALPIVNEKRDLSPKVKLEKERDRAERVYEEAVGLVGNVMKDVKLGNAIEVKPIENLANEINDSVLNNQNALLCLSQIREKDKYLLEHSINVGILMGIFSRHLGYDKSTVHQLVTGAILHDIGKIRVPDNILHKPGKLEEDEWEEMKRHVNYGVEVLQKTPGISDITMSICALHHERLDGNGYPNNLKQEKINIYGRLASIVDVYDAVTAKRVYHDGMPPFEAMKLLRKLAGDQLDKELVFSFIQCMGVFPVGSLVELNNGRLAVVVETKAGLPDKPIVRSFYNVRHKHHEQPKKIDLSSKLVEAKIVATHNPDEYDFDLSEFL